MKQFGEEIRDEERVGKDQRPAGYSFKADLNSPSLYRFPDSQHF